MACCDEQYTAWAAAKRITAGSKGGKPGQWSARKAQMVSHKEKGGGYKGVHEEWPRTGKKKNTLIEKGPCLYQEAAWAAG